MGAHIVHAYTKFTDNSAHASVKPKPQNVKSNTSNSPKPNTKKCWLSAKPEKTSTWVPSVSPPLNQSRSVPAPELHSNTSSHTQLFTKFFHSQLIVKYLW